MIFLKHYNNKTTALVLGFLLFYGGGLFAEKDFNLANEQITSEKNKSESSLSNRFRKEPELNDEDLPNPNQANEAKKLLLIDVPALTGSLLFLGNDGALKTFTNPAYLAFPSSPKSLISIISETSYGSFNQFQQNLTLTSQPNSGYGLWKGNLGIGLHNLIKNWDFGLNFGSPESNFYKNLQLTNTKVDPNAFTGITLNGDNSMLNEFRYITLYQAFISVGASLKLSKNKALGFSFAFIDAKQQRFIDIFADVTTPFVAQLKTKEDLTTFFKEYRANFTYLYHTKNGSLSVGLLPFSMKVATTNQKSFQQVSSGASVISVADESNTATNISLNQPQLSFGLSQLLLNKVKLYAEVINFLPITNKYDYYELFDPANGTQKFSDEVSEKWSLRFATGAAVNLWRGLNFHMGAYVHQQKYSSDSKEYEESYSKLGASVASKVLKQIANETWGFSGGFSYALNHKIALSVGGGFEQFYSKEARFKFDSVKKETSSENSFILTQNININLGLRWSL